MRGARWRGLFRTSRDIVVGVGSGSAASVIAARQAENHVGAMPHWPPA